MTLTTAVLLPVEEGAHPEEEVEAVLMDITAALLATVEGKTLEIPRDIRMAVIRTHIRVRV